MLLKHLSNAFVDISIKIDSPLLITVAVLGPLEVLFGQGVRPDNCNRSLAPWEAAVIQQLLFGWNLDLLSNSFVLSGPSFV